jgi:hypothetical protein
LCGFALGFHNPLKNLIVCAAHIEPQRSELFLDLINLKSVVGIAEPCGVLL